MAGSYNHCVDDKGNLRTNDELVESIENLGDAFEAIEEMYGMIWWLAYNTNSMLPAKLRVELARRSFAEGLILAKQTQNKTKMSS